MKTTSGNEKQVISAACCSIPVDRLMALKRHCGFAELTCLLARGIFLIAAALLLCGLLSAASICLGESSTSNNGETTGVISGETIPAVLDTVIVQGIEEIQEAAVRTILLSAKGGVLNDGLVKHDREALRDLLQREGWWQARVDVAADTTAEGNAKLVFTLIPGRPVFLGKVSVKSVGKEREEIPLPAISSEGGRFTSMNLDRMVAEVMTRYTDEGYPGVVVSPTLSAEGDTVNVALVVTAGQRAHVDSIAVLGLTRTREYVIRRGLRSLLGKPAGARTLLDAGKLLEKVEFVSPAEDPVMEYGDDGRGILTVMLAEGKQGSFDGAVGYQPAAGGESGEMVGKVDMEFPNILGTARSSQIRWEKLGKETEDLELRYTEPWLAGMPVSMDMVFIQEQRERLDFTRTVFQASFSRMLGRLRTGAGYRYEKVSADSLSSSDAHGVDAEFTWEGLDNLFAPRSGIRYAVRWTRLSKSYRFGQTEANSLRRLEFDLDHYVPSFAGQTLAVLLRFRKVETPLGTMSLADRYWLGGASSIRGYREKIFPAVKALWGSLEYRIMQGRSSWFFLFADSGYLVNQTVAAGGDNDTKAITRTGYGFGIRLESKAGTMGFDFGLGQGDSFGEGKIHVGLKTAF